MLLCGAARSDEPVYQIDIPAMNAAQALNRFAEQTDTIMLFSYDLASARQTNAVRGRYTLLEGLELLLRGTGLSGGLSDKRAVNIFHTGDARRKGEETPVLYEKASFKKRTMTFLSSMIAASAASGQELPSIEEVTVTGKRAELYTSRVVTSGVLGDKDPFDIPFSVASYSSELAKLQGAYTPIEILKNDPASQSPGLDIYPSKVILRGFFPGAGGTRRDGQFGNDVGDSPIEAFERIEVVKGVAGFLYGFADPGGVLNYVTKRPTRDPFSSIDLQLRSDEGQYAHLDAGGPILGGRLGYRINLAREDQGDFTHRNDILRNVAALSIDAKINDALLLRFDGTYQSREQPGQRGLPRMTNGMEPPEYDARKAVVPRWARAEFESSGGGIRAEYQLSENWQIIAQGRYDNVNAELGLGTVNSLQPNGDLTVRFFNFPFGHTDNHSTTWQAMALGTVSTGPVQHELAFGVFKLHSSHEVSYAQTQIINAIVRGNLFQPEFSPMPQVPASPYGVLLRNLTAETHYFIGDTISVGERWQLLAGVRHTDVKWDDKRVVGSQYTYEAEKSSPSAAVIFKPNESLRFYGSYARSLQIGYRSPCGGVDIVNPCEIQPPIEATQVEVGAKARVGTSLDLGLSLYEIELPSDYVDERTRVFGRFGEQRNRGVELTAAGNVLPNLAIVAGVGYLDPVRTQNANPAFDGKKVHAMARLTSNMFVNYGLPRIPGLSLMAGVYHVGSRYFDIANAIEVDGYTRVDLGAQYRMKLGSMPVRLRANVHNVMDEFYWEGLWYNSYSAGNGRIYSLAAEFQLY